MSFSTTYDVITKTGGRAKYIRRLKPSHSDINSSIRLQTREGKHKPEAPCKLYIIQSFHDRSINHKKQKVIMRPTILLTMAAALIGMVSAQYGSPVYERDVDASDAWEGLVRRAAEPEPSAFHEAVTGLMEENPHLVRRMSDVFRAVRLSFPHTLPPAPFSSLSPAPSARGGGGSFAVRSKFTIADGDFPRAQAMSKFDNHHRKREGRMTTAEERECEDACKKTYVRGPAK